MALLDKLKQKIIDWAMREPPPSRFPLCDFDRLRYEIRPCDVLLIEGKSRVSEVIRVVTQSPWSHAALYIGRIHDIENPVLRDRIREFYDGPMDAQLVIESMLGEGTIVTRLDHYRGEHIRICRPKGLSMEDAQKVIGFAVGRLGMEYAIRHNLDLFRLLFPWSFLPRKWRSSLFEHNIGTPTKEICSSMLAEAFSSVKFPILPIIKGETGKSVQFYHRNPKLYVPSDFDYSPYFEIIKYPMLELGTPAVYRNLPWNEDAFLSSEDEEIPVKPEAEKPEPATVRPNTEVASNNDDLSPTKSDTNNPIAPTDPANPEDTKQNNTAANQHLESFTSKFNFLNRSIS